MLIYDLPILVSQVVLAPTQGLLQDPIRGQTTQCEKRYSNTVYGWNTPWIPLIKDPEHPKESMEKKVCLPLNIIEVD